ncbi:MAG: hypothetical protein ABIA63_15270, partial [bacterium]
HELYVYGGGTVAFKYYARRFNYNGDWINGIMARDDWNKYDQEMSDLLMTKKQPLWLIFAHIWDANGVNEEKYIVTKARKWAVQKDYFHAFAGASAYLFEPFDIN